jgi:hypothetical protein
MKRASRSLVSIDQAKYVPVEWRDRVKVQITEHISKEDMEIGEQNTRLEKEFVQMVEEPNVSVGNPYKEMWTLSDESTKEKNIGGRPDDAGDSAVSSRIPGAIAIQPQLTEALSRMDMQASDNAMWLLVIAINEHTKKVLRDSIGLKQAIEAGRVGVPTLRYPKVLASPAPQRKRKSDGSRARAVIHANQSKKEKEKRSITPMDIFAAAQRYPTGQIGSLGGSFSRFSVEHTFHSAFNSLPMVEIGQNFIDVQTFVSDQVLDMAAKLEAKSNEELDGTKQGILISHPANLQSTDEKSQLVSIESNTARQSTHVGTSTASQPVHVNLNAPVPQATHGHDEPSKMPKDMNVKDSHPPPLHVTPSADSAVTSPTPKPAVQQESTGTTSDSTTVKPERSSIRGMGRGAKDLAALMKRSAAAASAGDSLGRTGETRNEDDGDRGQGPDGAGEQTPPVAQLHSQSKPVQDEQDGSSPATTTVQTNAESAVSAAVAQATSSVSTGAPRKGKGMGAKNLAAMLARSKSTCTTSANSTTEQPSQSTSDPKGGTDVGNKGDKAGKAETAENQSIPNGALDGCTNASQLAASAGETGTGPRTSDGTVSPTPTASVTLTPGDKSSTMETGGTTTIVGVDASNTNTETKSTDDDDNTTNNDT